MAFPSLKTNSKATTETAAHPIAGVWLAVCRGRRRLVSVQPHERWQAGLAVRDWTRMAATFPAENRFPSSPRKASASIKLRTSFIHVTCASGFTSFEAFLKEAVDKNLPIADSSFPYNSDAADTADTCAAGIPTTMALKTMPLVRLTTTPSLKLICRVGGRFRQSGLHLKALPDG